MAQEHSPEPVHPTEGPATSELLLRGFFDGLRQQSQFVRDLNLRTNKLLAERFSPFSYLDVMEPKLSSITADLLQPDGSHGQGDVFLRAFLLAIGVPDRGAPVRIRVEQPTRFIESVQRRVDIKLCWNDFIVGIENKPWALDQLDQLEDYVNDLDRESKGRFLCVYLSGDGTPPDSSSISPERRVALEQKRQLKILSYPKIMCGWLDDCILKCQADKVRWFLRDFREYLLRQFPRSALEGRTMNVSDDVIVAYALLNKHNLELASAVGARFSRIKSAVISKFAEALEEELSREPNVVVSDDASSLLFPIDVDRHGDPPLIVKNIPPSDQVRFILDHVDRYIASAKCSWCDIGVLFAAQYHNFVTDFCQAFTSRFGADKLYWVTENRNAKTALDISSECVKLSTIESAKGLEFQVVFLVAMEMLPRNGRDETSERRLAYVGMTRAQDALFVLGNENKGFFAEIVQISGRPRG